VGVDLFVDHDTEAALLEAVRMVRSRCTPGPTPPADVALNATAVHPPAAASTVPVTGTAPALLFFSGSTDPKAVKRLRPVLEQWFAVHVFVVAQKAIDAIMAGDVQFAVCIAKLGSKGNLGVDVLRVLRAVQGRGPFVAIHSATAAEDRHLQEKLEGSIGVDLFVSHEDEELLLQKMPGLVRS
jgi:hypothetical protein